MTDPLVERAKAVLDTERQALENAANRAPEQVAAAARLILEREPADVVITGVGKSGHIAHKLAATFSSVGTRTHFYWTSEMFHGDLGAVDQAGVVIIISKSGSGADIAQLIDFCSHRGIGLIGIISDTHSPIVPTNSTSSSTRLFSRRQIRKASCRPRPPRSLWHWEMP